MVFLPPDTFFFNKSYIKGKEEGAYEKEKASFYEDTSTSKRLNSELLNNQLEISYNKGKEFGIIEERKKLSICITPKMNVKDGFFNKTAITGYNLQVTYDGFPIGNPQYNIIDTIEKFKEENFKYTIDKVNQSMITLTDMFLEKQLKVVKILLNKEDVKIEK